MKIENKHNSIIDNLTLELDLSVKEELLRNDQTKDLINQSTRVLLFVTAYDDIVVFLTQVSNDNLHTSIVSSFNLTSLALVSGEILGLPMLNVYDGKILIEPSKNILYLLPGPRMNELFRTNLDNFTFSSLSSFGAIYDIASNEDGLFVLTSKVFFVRADSNQIQELDISAVDSQSKIYALHDFLVILNAKITPNRWFLGFGGAFIGLGVTLLILVHVKRSGKLNTD